MRGTPSRNSGGHGGLRRASTRPVRPPARPPAQSSGHVVDEKQQSIDPNPPPLAVQPRRRAVLPGLHRISRPIVMQQHMGSMYPPVSAGSVASRYLPVPYTPKRATSTSKSRPGTKLTTPKLSITSVSTGRFSIRARQGVDKGVINQIKNILKRAKKFVRVNSKRLSKSKALSVIITLLGRNETVDLQIL